MGKEHYSNLSTFLKLETLAVYISAVRPPIEGSKSVLYPSNPSRFKFVIVRFEVAEAFPTEAFPSAFRGGGDVSCLRRAEGIISHLASSYQQCTSGPVF
jgi:hypothetical protein